MAQMDPSLWQYTTPAGVARTQPPLRTLCADLQVFLVQAVDAGLKLLLLALQFTQVT
jgi:hypothetical protein